ncbi:MAG: FAD-binding oxidoreductase [Pyrodictiaceae archaeon]
MPHYDVVIVGAGIVGLSTAYHILRRDPGKKIVLVDKAPGLGGGDSGRSAAAFRAFFYSRTNLLLAHSSIEFYRHIQEEEKFDLGMMFVGYLFVFEEEKYKTISRVLTELRRRGLEYYEYEPEDLEKLLGLRRSLAGDEEAEAMGLKDPYRGVYVPLAGVLRPERLLDYYAQNIRKMGGEILFNTTVKGFIIEPKKALGIPGEPFPWQEAEVKGVVTDKGEIRAEKIIVAAGAWTHKLLDPIGIDCHSKPKKRQIFTIPADTPELERLLYVKGMNKYNVMPFLILPRGVYVRPEPHERRFWVGLSDELGRPFKLEEDPQPEERFYLYGIYPVLHKYLPQFKDMRPSSMWAGHYDISLDGQPVIFEEYSLIVSAGTSGSGIMKADAIGRITAALYFGEKEVELYTGEGFRVSDLSLKNRRVEPELLII